MINFSFPNKLSPIIISLSVSIQYRVACGKKRWQLFKKYIAQFFLIWYIKYYVEYFFFNYKKVFENQLVNQFPSQLKNLKSRESIKLQAESPLRGKAHCSKHT